MYNCILTKDMFGKISFLIVCLDKFFHKKNKKAKRIEFLLTKINLSLQLLTKLDKRTCRRVKVGKLI